MVKLLAVILAVVAWAAEPLAQTITGTVVVDATGQPVRRALVIVHGSQTKTTRVTSSDVNGAFRFEGLPADRYRVGASKAPLLSAVADVTDGPVVVRLPEGAVVTGTVVDQLGQPVSTTLTISGDALPSAIRASSNLSGEYRFFGLPPGDYTIAPQGRKGEPRTITIAAAAVTQVPVIAVEGPATPAIPGRSQPTSGTNSVAGLVVDAVTNTPLAFAPVLSRATGIRTVTDSTGRFQINELGDGTYTFLVEGAGYSPASSATVTLGGGGITSDLTLRARRFGSIGGVVRDEFGDPVAGLTVTTHRRQFLNMKPVLMPRGMAVTDEQGAFVFESHPPGEYLVCACPTEALAFDPRLIRLLGPTMPDRASLARLAGQTVQTFPPTYYPGRIRQSDSLLVTVESGDIRRGMDITVYGVTPYAVSGRLVEGLGPPSQKMQAILAQDGDLPGAVGSFGIPAAELGADGRFRFFGVPPGTYTLSVTKAAFDKTPGPFGFLEVTVSDRDVTDLIVPLGPGLTVSGRVDFSGTIAPPTPADLTEARLSLFPLDLSMAMFTAMNNTGSVGHGTTLDESGRFSVTGLAPGRYLAQIQLRNSPWRTVTRVSAAADSTIDDVLTVGEGGANDVLIVVSNAALATIEGTADIAPHESGSMRVVAFPADPDLWREPDRYARRFSFVFVERDRSFRLTDLPPGDYLVAIVSTFGFEMSPRNLERWAKTAERATLRPGDTRTLVLRR